MNKRLLLLLPLLLCISCIAQLPVSNIPAINTEGDPIPTLVGRASSTSWFWLWTTGDSSVEQAKKNGGITNVTSISRATNSFLGIIVHEAITVRGE